MKTKRECDRCTHVYVYVYVYVYTQDTALCGATLSGATLRGATLSGATPSFQLSALSSKCGGEPHLELRADEPCRNPASLRSRLQLRVGKLRRSSAALRGSAALLSALSSELSAPSAARRRTWS